MSRKAKQVIFSCSLLIALAAALFCALPYGYFLQAFLVVSGSDGILLLAWALYIFVAVLLWLLLWRILYIGVKMWPGRRG